MKRIVISIVALLALSATVESARADWKYVVNPTGWYGWEWDPTFDDGTYDHPNVPYLFRLKVQAKSILVSGFF